MFPAMFKTRKKRSFIQCNDEFPLVTCRCSHTSHLRLLAITSGGTKETPDDMAESEEESLRM